MSSNSPSLIDRPLRKSPKFEINQGTFAFLFAEIVKYAESKSYSITDVQESLTAIGVRVGESIVNMIFLREKGFKRETRLLPMLLFVKSNLWKNLFGKEIEKLEKATDEDNTYYLMEKEPLVNRFISVPKDKGNLNCAAFSAGIIQGFLCESNFKCLISTHWHGGTTYLVKFDDSIIAREKRLDGR